MDINADIGEGYDDAGLMPYLTRASIACGGHTGDARSIDAALTLAAEYGVAVGAHPSYPDRAGFGRREWAATPEQIAQWVTQQIEALAEIAASKGMRLAHIKPHGALYNAAAQHEVIATAIAQAVVEWDARLIMSEPTATISQMASWFHVKHRVRWSPTQKSPLSKLMRWPTASLSSR